MNEKEKKKEKKSESIICTTVQHVQYISYVVTPYDSYKCVYLSVLILYIW